MATVVDSLVVTLGLDASKYKAGQQEVSKSLKKTRDEANTFAKDLEASGKQAAQLFAQVKTEALGLIGTLVGAGGIAAFVGNTTRSLADLGREARNIGVAVPQLAAFRNMVERNGGSAESATQSMKGFVDQVERFKVFGDPTVFKFLNPIGANIDETPIAVFMKFVRFVEQHKGDIPLVNLIGHGLGFDQGLINTAIQIGNAADAQRQLNDEMHRVPTPEMIENATKLQQAWEDLSHQAKFTGDTILDHFSPALQSLLKGTTKLLAENPAVIDVLTGIAGALTAIAGIRITGGLLWFVGLRGASAALTAMVGALERMVPLLLPLALKGDQGPLSPDDQKAFDERNRQEEEEYRRNHGGELPQGESVGNWWRRVMPTWLGGSPSGQQGGTGGASPRRMAEIRDRLARDLGISTDAAAGIVSNLNAESGIQGINERNPAPGTRGGFGWAQWTGTRRDAFEAWSRAHGMDPASDQANYGFLIEELRTKYPGLLAQLRSGNISAYQAANLVFSQYESGGAAILEPSRPGHVATAENIARLPAAGDQAPGPSGLPMAIHIDPSLTPQLGGGAPIAGATTNASTAVHIGSITVHSQATDAHGVAMNIRDATHDAFTQQANRGLQ